jgi:hypothetical protein
MTDYREMNDRELANDLTVMACDIEKVMKALEARPVDSARCSCNQWTPGLCAYHAGVHGQIQDAARMLFAASAALLKDRNER